jgi:hypothetical protein
MPPFAVHEYAINDFTGQIQTLPVFFNKGDNSYAMRSMMKPGFADLSENFFAAVPERGVPKIVRQRDSLGQIFVKVEAARNAPGCTDHLEGVGQSGSEVVIGRRKKDLRLVLEPPERFTVNNAVNVALKAAANIAVIFRELAPPTFAGQTCEF